MINTAILTVSTTRIRETDLSGKKIEEMLEKDVYTVIAADVVKDDRDAIVARLRCYADELKADIVFTTGGTGLGPADVTPEATGAVVTRLVPGLSELMRLEGLKKTRKAVLSRGICGIRNSTLIINLPGSPRGAAESLGIIKDVFPHAIKMLKGEGHPAAG
jgi:molybdenum cofactor synthesis domain-containing protein